MSGLGLGSTGLSLGRGLIIQIGGGGTIGTPVLTLDTGPFDNTPEFTISFGADVQAGDLSILMWARDAAFTVSVDETPTLIDASDVTAGFINEVIGPLADGVWYFRAMITRGGAASEWSNVESEDIDTGNSPSLDFSVDTNSMYVPVLKFGIIGMISAGLLAMRGFMGV